MVTWEESFQNIILNFPGISFCSELILHKSQDFGGLLFLTSIQIQLPFS